MFLFIYLQPNILSNRIKLEFIKLLSANNDKTLLFFVISYYGDSNVFIALHENWKLAYLYQNKSVVYKAYIYVCFVLFIPCFFVVFLNIIWLRSYVSFSLKLIQQYTCIVNVSFVSIVDYFLSNCSWLFV